MSSARIRSFPAVRCALCAFVLSALVLLLTVSSALAAPEEPVTEAATAVTASSATLNGTVNPASEEMAGYYFTYQPSASECAAGFTTGQAGESTGKAGELKAEAPLTGLEPNREYTFCLVATHLEGETLEQTPGPPLSFKTLALAPSVDAESSSAVGEATAALESQINPNNQETSFRFDYSTEEAGGELTGTIQSAPGAAPLSGLGDQPANVTVEGLKPRTTYFFQAVAENEQSKTEGKPARGAVQSFTTLAKPLITTSAGHEVSRAQATLSGTVNPGGLETTYHFVYVEAAQYSPGAGECESGVACAYAAGFSTPVTVAGSDYAAHPAGPVQITELKPATTYDYALVASNSLGTEVGPNQELATLPPTPPSASTGEVFGVAQTSATITGVVDTRGLPTTLQFELLAPGVSVGQGSLITASAGERSASTVQVSVAFPGDLQPATTYQYRVVATNTDGTAQGALRSFTTTSFPAPSAFTPAAAPPFIPFLSIAELQAREAREHPTRVASGSKPTRQQLLAKALKVCRKKHNKARRVACEHQARHRYAPARKNGR